MEETNSNQSQFSKYIFLENMRVLLTSGIALGLSWASEFVILGHSQIIQASAIFFVSISVLLFLVCLINSLHSKRAGEYHLFVFLSGCVMAVYVFYIAVRVTAVKMGLSIADIYILSTICFMALLITIFTRTKSEISRLKLSIPVLRKSGRLNLHKGWWNPSVPVKLISTRRSQIEDAITRLLTVISPLVTAFALKSSRYLDGQTIALIDFFVIYLMGFAFAWGCTTHLALAIQIKIWESENKIEIMLRIEQKQETA